MGLLNSQTIDQSDFVTDTTANKSTPSSDANRVAKFESDGKIGAFFLPSKAGDGSDGAANFDGTNTFSFASKSGSTYTLTRNIYVTDLTIAASCILRPDGWRIFVSGTTAGTGKVQYNGNAGGNAANVTAGSTTAGTAGAAATQSGTGPLKNVPGVAGATGRTGGGANNALPGSSGTAQTGIGSTASNGGSGGGDASAPQQFASGGTGGTSTSYTKFGIFQFLVLMCLDFTSALGFVILAPQGQAASGAGGATSGGASKGSGGGGGSGASGGLIFICANNWADSWTYEAIGGNGGSGGTGGGSGGEGGGGGAGGNGGSLVVVYKSKSGTKTYTLTGGTGGAAGGSGGLSIAATAGTAGVTGTAYEYKLGALI